MRLFKEDDFVAALKAAQEVEPRAEVACFTTLAEQKDEVGLVIIIGSLMYRIFSETQGQLEGDQIKVCFEDLNCANPWESNDFYVYDASEKPKEATGAEAKDDFVIPFTDNELKKAVEVARLNGRVVERLILSQKQLHTLAKRLGEVPGYQFTWHGYTLFRSSLDPVDHDSIRVECADGSSCLWRRGKAGRSEVEGEDKMQSDFVPFTEQDFEKALAWAFEGRNDTAQLKVAKVAMSRSQYKALGDPSNWFAFSKRNQEGVHFSSKEYLDDDEVEFHLYEGAIYCGVAVWDRNAKTVDKLKKALQEDQPITEYDYTESATFEDFKGERFEVPEPGEGWEKLSSTKDVGDMWPRMHVIHADRHHYLIGSHEGTLKLFFHPGHKEGMALAQEYAEQAQAEKWWCTSWTTWRRKKIYTALEKVEEEPNNLLRKHLS